MLKKTKIIAFAIVLLLVATLFSSCFVVEPEYEETETGSYIDEIQALLPESQQNPELFKTLAYIDFLYQQNYVGEIDNDELTYYLMNAYIMCIGDPYGVYYSPEEVEALFNSTQGVNVGIGVYVRHNPETNEIKVLTAMDNTPAKNAGIISGDIITAVNGESLAELEYNEAVGKITGPEGSEVTITISRNGQLIDKTIIRSSYEAQNVFYRKHSADPTVGIIKIIDFTDVLPVQFKNAVNSLMADGCTSIIFDLRENGGGTLDSCVNILDFLLPEGDIVKITDMDGTVVEKYTSSASEIDIPMAVLVDGNTASAAELFTCALKDYDKAIIVGTKTYGKGCMQSIVRLPNGGALRITTQMYNPPVSENYDGVGITPDIVVELDSTLKSKAIYFEISDSEDNQMKSAYEALKNSK